LNSKEITATHAVSLDKYYPSVCVHIIVLFFSCRAKI